ncbi:MAG: hypothetical protein KU38_09425 [Sulfurovum sp. FS08-3]|nr:MAG: hypothetical protein KU38_09425 [Sulfurovum sp. FS08-3]
MKEVINIYKKHRLTVDNFISTLITSLPRKFSDNARIILKNHDYIELLYSVDKDFHQSTPVICRKREDTTHLHSDKSNYFIKLQLDEKGIYISNPYIHYRTGRASISVVYFKDEEYHVFDINLIEILEELKLIEYNSLHDKFKKAVYTLGSFLLAAVSIMLIVYGGYVFTMLIIGDANQDILHGVFKSIIAITLGLAIYDLAKQIFEHEVIFKSFHHDDDQQYKVLGKFLISIVIALAIETLMVVFKIALDDHTKMLSAFYLLIGTTLMFIGLGYFYKTIASTSKPEEH